MKRIYQPRVRTLLRIADTTNVADTRGRAFEILCCYLLGSVPGLRVVARDEVDFFESEEIDLMVTNDHDPDGLWFLAVQTDERGLSQIAPLIEAERTVMRKHLYTAGELLRSNQTQPDPALLPARSNGHIALFGE